jgi:prevent-host-death family protein
MDTIQASEAKTHFLRILDEVEQGKSVIITRHGKRIARIQPEREFDAERATLAFERIRELRKRVVPMTVEEILSARDEGRK